jgi:hypothetical protein
MFIDFALAAGLAAGTAAIGDAKLRTRLFANFARGLCSGSIWVFEIYSTLVFAPSIIVLSRFVEVCTAGVSLGANAV